MSIAYDQYLITHRNNVIKAYKWIKDNLPDLLKDCRHLEWRILLHDESKYSQEEYEAYDAYFYGGDRSLETTVAFNRAWLHHIHANPHHWQYWILHNDDPNLGTVYIEIPDEYVIEMICDWWSFGWKKNNLFELFEWYDANKSYICLNVATRKKVDDILKRIKSKLELRSSLGLNG